MSIALLMFLSLVMPYSFSILSIMLLKSVSVKVFERLLQSISFTMSVLQESSLRLIAPFSNGSLLRTAMAFDMAKTMDEEREVLLDECQEQ